MVFQSWPLCDMACGRPLAFVDDLRLAISMDQQGAKACAILDAIGLVGEHCTCCRRNLLCAKDAQNRELLDRFWTKRPDGSSPERAQQERDLAARQAFRAQLRVDVEPIDPRGFWQSVGFGVDEVKEAAKPVVDKFVRTWIDARVGGDPRGTGEERSVVSMVP